MGPRGEDQSYAGFASGGDPVSLFHGGVPDLRAGDVIEPGHQRRHHDGCPWCEARAKGEAFLNMDGPPQQPDRVYATTHRLYAKFHASLWGRGDLYRVTAVGAVERSSEDSFESVVADRLIIAAVLDRAVLLTDSERRRLFREWGAADQIRGHSMKTGHMPGSPLVVRAC